MKIFMSNVKNKMVGKMKNRSKIKNWSKMKNKTMSEMKNKMKNKVEKAVGYRMSRLVNSGEQVMEEQDDAEKGEIWGAE